MRLSYVMCPRKVNYMQCRFTRVNREQVTAIDLKLTVMLRKVLFITYNEQYYSNTASFTCLNVSCTSSSLYYLYN